MDSSSGDAPVRRQGVGEGGEGRGAGGAVGAGGRGTNGGGRRGRDRVSGLKRDLGCGVWGLGLNFRKVRMSD
jgi:hypothetical protein